MVANSTWGNNTQYGMYSFTAPEYTSTLLKQEEELLPNGGGVLVGDTYYLTYFYSYYGYNFVYFERYNAETWEFWATPAPLCRMLPQTLHTTR